MKEEEEEEDIVWLNREHSSIFEAIRHLDKTKPKGKDWEGWTDGEIVAAIKEVGRNRRKF